MPRPSRAQEIYEDFKKTLSVAATAHNFGVSKAYVYTIKNKLEAEEAAAPAPKPFVIKPKTPPAPSQPAPQPEPAPLLELMARGPPPKVEVPVPGSAAPPPLPLSLQYAISTAGYKGAGPDLAKITGFLLTKLYPRTNAPIWTLLRLALETGGTLEIISPHHTKDGTDHYYSIRITDKYNNYYTAHLHGPLLGTRFVLNEAEVFYKGETYLMLFTRE